MNLNSESQIYMMEIIKNQMSDNDLEVDIDLEKDDNDVDMDAPIDTHHVSSKPVKAIENNSTNTSTNIPSTNEKEGCEDSVHIDNQPNLTNTNAPNAPTATTITNNGTIKTLEMDVTNLNSRVIDMELVIIEKDDQLSTAHLECRQLVLQIADLQETNSMQTDIVNEYELIKDDLGECWCVLV